MQPQMEKFFQFHNPFYLLSALCMFAGCYGLLHSLTMAPGHTETLLVLMSVVQVYELLLVGLAWYLIKSRHSERDGRILLLLELPFLVDATNLSSEYGIADPNGGMLVGLITLFLAAVKIGVILNALGLRFRLKTYYFLLTHFGALLAIPLVSSGWSNQGRLSDGFFYGVWWLVGLLPLVHGWMVDEYRSRPLPNTWLRPLERNIRVALIALPFLSTCWHAASLQWMFGFPFHASYLAPLVLGLGVSFSRAHGSSVWGLRIRWLTPLVAVLLSAGFPAKLLFPVAMEILLSPLRLVLLAAAIVYLWSFWSCRRWPFLFASTSGVLLALAGYSFTTIVETVSHLGNHFVPRTTAEWCLLSIAGAFAFLFLGAAVSLSNDRGRRRDAGDAPDPAGRGA